MEQKNTFSLKTETILTSHSPNETLLLGKLLANRLTTGTIVALYGQLGSGKTILVKGFCQGLNVKDSVTSPSFTIMNIYSGLFPVFHYDFYRLERGSNWDDLGLDEYLFNGGISFIEWPDRLENWLPEDAVEIFIQRVKPPSKKNEKQRRLIIRNLQLDDIDLTRFRTET